ncbi:MAG: hypothetical protein ACKVVT_12585 [Dehalococcoidia bacterium]
MEKQPPGWFAPVAVAVMAFVGVAVVWGAYLFATSNRDEPPARASLPTTASATRTPTTVSPTATATPRPRGTATPSATPGPTVACQLLPQAEVEAAFGTKLRADRDNQTAGEPCTYRATGVDRAVGASLRVFGTAQDARNLLALKDWELREIAVRGAEAYAIIDKPGSFTVLIIKGEAAVQLDVFDARHPSLWELTATLAAGVARRME